MRRGPSPARRSRILKPANIIVDAGGVPKLLDFGIAKLLEAEGGDALTRVTERMMTPEYASPEQVRGDTVTTSADVYALGILLFELLAGRRPFRLETKSPLEIAQVICEQDPEPPSSIMRKTASPGRAHLRKADSDLDNIVLMAMRKEPSRRYASVSALSADVQAYLSGYPVQARTDHWSYRSHKFVIRHRGAVAAAVLVTLSLVGFSIGMGVLAGRANRARLAAEREAEFLSTIFQAATPDQAKGNTVTARDLLDQGVKRIDSELAGQPEVQATMLDNVGRAYSSIGLYGQAASLLERAFQIRRRILARDSLETVSTEDALATALRLDGHYAQAEPYFRDALEVRKQRLGSNDGMVADSMSDLGECLYWEDRTAEAESLLRQALDIDRRLNRSSGVSTRNYLALVLERSGDFPAAAQLLREAVDMERQSKGTDSAAYMVSLHNYAGALIDSGDLNAAENTERQVLALREKVFGIDHPDVFYPLNNLGFILLEKGEWRQAMPVLDRSVALIRKVGIPVKLANALGNRARGFAQKGDFAAADRDLNEAMKIMSDGGEQKSWVAAKIKASAGSLELEKGNYAAAAESARRALKLERELGGEGSPSYASGLVVLGDALLLAGDSGAAESAYREALLIRRKKFNSGNPVIAETETRLGEALTRDHKADEAEPLLREAAASMAESPFPLPSWRIAEANFVRGACLQARGRTEEGVGLMRSSESALRSHPQGPFRWPAIVRAVAVEPH